ncbi:MAG: hypothetical protein K2X47_02830, partial [Bdellovibrionales bacterium]|nr:hypothetical protein [Bdellovibrionales bacterium]
KDFSDRVTELTPVVIIDDTTMDPLTQGHPSVLGQPFVRFYAGVSITSPHNEPLGVLSIFDRVPKKLHPSQKILLQIYGTQIGHLLEKHRREEMLALALERTNAEKLEILARSNLSALGEVAATVVHEINNRLESIVSKAGQLRLQAHSNTLSLQSLESTAKTIEDTGLCIADIVRSILSVARGKPLQQNALVPFKQILQEVRNICDSRLQKHSIALTSNFQNAPSDVRFNSTQLTHVILNLIFNSIDAIQDLKEKWIQLGVTMVDGWIEISVTDSGPGIPPEIQTKMMKPFFTTKPIGKGTGLGLSISQKILKAHGGTLAYDPESAHTRFLIRFPT